MRNSLISSAASIWVIRCDFYVHLPVASVRIWRRISGERSWQYVIYFSLEFGWQFLCGNSVDVLTDEDDNSTFEWFFNVLLCVHEIEIQQYASAKARIFDTFPTETKSMQILVSEVQAGSTINEWQSSLTSKIQLLRAASKLRFCRLDFRLLRANETTTPLSLLSFWSQLSSDKGNKWKCAVKYVHCFSSSLHKNDPVCTGKKTICLTVRPHSLNFITFYFHCQLP